MTTASAIFDISALVLLVICTLYYARKGFLSGIISLAGTVASIVLSYFISRNLAPSFFASFIRPGLEERIAAALAQQTEMTVQGLQAALESVVGFLPDYAAAAVVNAYEYSSTPNAAEFAAGMVTDLIEPMFTPVIALVLFVLSFMLLRILFGVLNRIVRGLARLPLLGTANSALGAAMGVFVAAVYVFLAVMLLGATYAALGGLSPLDNPFTGSIFYRLFSSLPFF